MEKYSFYNRNLRKFARDNRKTMTKAEVFLWKYILKARMTGYKFRRQRPVLNYIADFMCIELKLIIEVDGNTHLSESAKEKDKIRQQILEEHGFKVIRFTDGEVLLSLGWVNDKIMEAINTLKVGSSLPPRSSGTPSRGRWLPIPLLRGWILRSKRRGRNQRREILTTYFSNQYIIR
jgi:very-short-patch-repair endonuclease